MMLSKIILLPFFIATLLCGQVTNAQPIETANKDIAPPSKDFIGVEFKTNMGKIRLKLNAKKAPKTVANFLRYVDVAHYDDTVFHRVIPNFMIQGGGFDKNLVQKTVFDPVVNESKNGLYNDRGTIAMARTNDPDSATAQFFINVKSNSSLNGSKRKPGYSVFGEVIHGMHIVYDIALTKTVKRGRHQNVPKTPVIIEKAYRVDL